MTSSTHAKVIGASLAAALGVAAVAVALQAFVFSSPDNAGNGPHMHADLAVLETPATESDFLSPELVEIAADLGNGGVPFESARFLGEHQSTRYWAATDRGSNVCLLFQTTSGVMGHACGAATQFNHEGVAVAVAGYNPAKDTEGSLSVRMLPDRADTSSTPEYEPVAANVIRFNPELGSTGDKEIVVPARSGQPLRFNVLGDIAGEASLQE